MSLDVLRELDPLGLQWNILSESRTLVCDTKSPSGVVTKEGYLYGAMCKRCEKGNGFVAEIPERKLLASRAKWCTCKPCTVDANGVTLWCCKYCKKRLPIDKFQSRFADNIVPRLPCNVCYERTQQRAEKAKELKRARDDEEVEERVVKQYHVFRNAEIITAAQEGHNNAATAAGNSDNVENNVINDNAENIITTGDNTTDTEPGLLPPQEEDADGFDAVQHEDRHEDGRPSNVVVPTTSQQQDNVRETETTFPGQLSGDNLPGVPTCNITKVEKNVETSMLQISTLSGIMDQYGWKADVLIAQLKWLSLQ